MGERLPADIDRMIGDLIAARSVETGSSPESLAREALLKGLLWSPSERTAYADRVRETIAALALRAGDHIAKAQP